MKKVLFICYSTQLQFGEEMSKQLTSEEILCNIVSHEDALVEFLSEDYDVIFCITEPKPVIEKVGKFWKDAHSVFKDVEKSKQDNQKLFRLGFVSETAAKDDGNTPFIELPVFPEDLRKKILE